MFLICLIPASFFQLLALISFPVLTLYLFFRWFLSFFLSFFLSLYVSCFLSFQPFFFFSNFYVFRLSALSCPSTLLLHWPAHPPTQDYNFLPKQNLQSSFLFCLSVRLETGLVLKLCLKLYVFFYFNFLKFFEFFHICLLIVVRYAPPFFIFSRVNFCF